MNDNRILYLFGAGAAREWGGPRTDDITQSIREAGFNCKDRNIKVTELIYDHLQCRNRNERDIHFEDIFSAIEDLYSENSPKSDIASLPRSNHVQEQIFNFELKDDRWIFIPDKKIEQEVLVTDNKTPKQIYLEELMAVLLDTIGDYIDNYSINPIANNPNTSHQFSEWIKEDIQRGRSIRIYTLNYDDVFKRVIEDSTQISIFDGFKNGKESRSMTYKSDPVRIVQDQENHVHYNLHGSLYWRVGSYNSERIDLPEFMKSDYREFPTNEYHYYEQELESGRFVVVNPIVTGYEKIQKSFTVPLKQMHSIFIRDCLMADEIKIVGYSFGDQYINDHLINALKYNSNIGKSDFTIVNPEINDDMLPNQYWKYLKKVKKIPKCFGEFLEEMS